MNISIDKFESFLSNKGLKERTIENYVYYFNKFTYDFLNQETVSKFLADKSNRNTVARGFLLNFKKFLLLNYIEFGLTNLRVDIASVELPKITGRKKERIIHWISKEDIHKLERYLPTEKEKLELLLSYYCGLRLGGLLKIKIISFNWQEWAKDISDMGECRVFEKGDKEGIALVPPELMERTSKFIHNGNFKSVNSYLFINPTKEKQKMKDLAKTWQNKLAKAGKDSGIAIIGPDGKTVEGTSVHPHLLRHSYASHLLNVVGLNLAQIKELLRHSDISSTQIYTHVDQKQKKDKIRNIYSG